MKKVLISVFLSLFIFALSGCDCPAKIEPAPEDFSFTLTWGFDGYYDSKTGTLRNGYNYTLDTACETTLLLDADELAKIYKIFYDGGLFDIKENFSVSDYLWEPSYDIKISYTVGGETVSFTIYGASHLTYDQWSVRSDFGQTYFQVIDEFIKSSDEYKALPKNQMLYM